jgi:hypothetical protein
MLHRLSVKQYVILAGVFALIYGWVLIDQLFLPLVFQRFIALIIVALVSITFYFFIVKPSEPFQLSAHLGILLGVVTVIIAIIEHIIIRFDFSFKPLLICVIAFVSPFISGFIYRSIKHRE